MDENTNSFWKFFWLGELFWIWNMGWFKFLRRWREFLVGSILPFLCHKSWTTQTLSICNVLRTQLVDGVSMVGGWLNNSCSSVYSIKVWIVYSSMESLLGAGCWQLLFKLNYLFPRYVPSIWLQSFPWFLGGSYSFSGLPRIYLLASLPGGFLWHFMYAHSLKDRDQTLLLWQAPLIQTTAAAKAISAFLLPSEEHSDSFSPAVAVTPDSSWQQALPIHSTSNTPDPNRLHRLPKLS